MKAAIVTFCALALGGCSLFGSSPPKAPEPCGAQTVGVRLLASERLNVGADGDPRPLVVRVYRLKSDLRLDRVSFDQFWHDDKAVLGEDLIKMDEVQLFPGARADLNFQRDVTVQTVAAVALFQSPRGRTWLSIADLAPLAEPGRCSPSDCPPDDDECRIRANSTPVVPVYFDAASVDDGSDALSDYPVIGPKQRKGAPASKGPVR